MSVFQGFGILVDDCLHLGVDLVYPFDDGLFLFDQWKCLFIEHHKFIIGISPSAIGGGS